MSRDLTRQTRSSTTRIRRSFVRNLVLLILLIVGLVVSLAWIQGEKAQVNSYRQIIQQKANLADESIRASFSRVESAVTVLKKWSQNGLLSFKNIKAITVKLIPMLEDLSNVSSIIIADSEGRSYLLTRKDNVWLTRFVDRNKSEEKAWFKSWREDGSLLKEWTEKVDYDARKRPWYKGAVKAGPDGKVFWTTPYVFFNKKMTGITAAASWSELDAPEKIQVVAYDVCLDDIYQTVTNLHVSDNGEAFLFNEKGAVLQGRLGDERLPPRATLFVPYEQLPKQNIANAIVLWKKQLDTNGDPVSFVLGQQKWWADFYPIGPENLSLRLGIVIPESDFFAFKQRNYYVVASIAGVLLCGVLLVIFLTRKYTREIQKMRHRVINRENLADDIRKLIEAGESESLEFKSTMRQNLKSKKPGKEIELAWLKTVVAYLNTDGGFLLFGVADDGEIVGMGPDLFLSDDHCLRHFKNLIHQHIGIEFANMIYFDLVELDGKVIGLVDCNPADEPAFLLNKDTEEFFVRSGPATIKLSSKKMLKFLEDRKRDS